MAGLGFTTAIGIGGEREMANLLTQIEEATIVVAAIGGAVGNVVTQLLETPILEVDPMTIGIAAVAGGVVTFIAFEVLKRVG